MFDVKGDSLILELRQDSITFINLPSIITASRSLYIKNSSTTNSMIAFDLNNDRSINGNLNRYTGELGISERNEKEQRFKWLLEGKCFVAKRLF